MSALAPLVEPPPRIGGTDPLSGGLAVAASDPQAIPPPQSLVPSNMQLSANPMLPAHPLGAYTDSQYEAQDAILRNQVAKQYADLLQQLGYRDNAGNFIQGSVETEANKQNQLLARQQQLAAQGVTDEAQRSGTLFSGMRGTLQARAEEPYVGQRADLASATPLTIQKLYEQASGLTNDYILGQNQELANAAQRAAAGLTANPPGGGGGGGTGDGTAAPTTPDAGASVAPSLNTDAVPLPGVRPPLTQPGINTTLDRQIPFVPTAPSPTPIAMTPQQQAAAAMVPGQMTFA